MYRYICLFLSAIVLAIAGCGSCAASIPLETPTPPPELWTLPQEARIVCSGNPALDKGSVVLWELPGVDPADPNSAYQGDRGRELGTLAHCTAVTLTGYAWSRTDQEFWGYVKAKGLAGWVSLDLVDFPS